MYYYMYVNMCICVSCVHAYVWGHGLWYTYEGQRTTSVSPCLLLCGSQGQTRVLKLDSRRLCPLSHLPWPLGEHFLHLKFFLEKEDVHKFEDSLGISKTTDKYTETLSIFPCPSPVLVHNSSISSMCTQNKLVKYALWGRRQGGHALDIRTVLLIFDR